MTRSIIMFIGKFGTLNCYNGTFPYFLPFFCLKTNSSKNCLHHYDHPVVLVKLYCTRTYVCLLVMWIRNKPDILLLALSSHLMMLMFWVFFFFVVSQNLEILFTDNPCIIQSSLSLQFLMSPNRTQLLVQCHFHSNPWQDLSRFISVESTL